MMLAARLGLAAENLAPHETAAPFYCGASRGDAVISPCWNVAQASAWIATRDVEFIESLGCHASIAATRIKLAEWARETGGAANIDMALSQLADACVVGNLVMYGRRRGFAAEAIPKHAWPYLCAIDAGGGQLVIYRDAHSQPRRFPVDSWTEVYAMSAEVRSAWPASNRTGGKIGRRQKWDWNAMREELESFLSRPGAILPQVEAERHIADWFMKLTGDEPSESRIREKVGEVYRRYMKSGR